MKSYPLLNVARRHGSVLVSGGMAPRIFNFGVT